MANTGNTQQIIDYGATANDGTGDPLRTAFIKTDENFSNIWAAGPVGSNIVIANNTIQNDSTNGNIILKPNGVGVIQANASILPSIDGVRDLGSNTRAWRRAYINILEVDDLTLSGNLNVPGDAVIQGNLTVEGDTIQIGNITTDTLLIQLANAAANGAQADGAGITVGANDDIATMLYDNGANRWEMSVGLITTGNIAAPYYTGNGSLLTGMYGNANMVANLAALSSNPVVTTGNVTANYFLGNGSQLTGMYGNTNVAAYLPTYTGNLSASKLTISSGANAWTVLNANLNAPSGGQWQSDLSTLDDYITSAANGYINIQSLFADGNIASELHLEHGVAHIRVADGPYNDWYFNSSGSMEVPGDILPQANGAYSLGSATNYWANLWVANNTIYIGGVPLGMTAGNVLTVAGEPVLTNDSDTSITTTGNITANVITATGAINVGDMSIGELPGYITADANIGMVVNVSGPDGGFVVDYLKEDGNANTSQGELAFSSETGNATYRISLTDDAGDGFATKIWRFDGTGNLTLPSSGNIIGAGNVNFNNGSRIQTATNNINLQANVNGAVELKSHGGNYTWAFDNYGWMTLPEADAAYTPVANGSVLFGPTALTFKAGLANLTFESTGNLTSAGNISADGNISAANLAISSSGNTWTISDQFIRGPGGAYWHSHPEQQQSEFVSAPGEFVSIRSIDVANVTEAELFLGNTYAEIFVENGVNHRWRFNETGILEAAGDITPVTAGGAPANIGNATNQWTNANFSGNVTANYFIGDGSQLTGLPAQYGDSNVATFLASYGSNTISTTGNVTAGNFIGSGTNVDIIAGSYDWTFDSAGTLTLPGNTFAVNYANGTAVALGGNYNDSNVATLLAAFGSNTISTTGNITGGYVLGNGSQLTGLPATYGNANVVANLAALSSNPISTSGNITGGYILGNGSQLTGVASLSFSTVSANGTSVVADSATDTLTLTPGNNLVITGNATSDTVTLAVSDSPTFSGTVTAQSFSGNISVTGNVTGTSSNVDIIAGSYQWTFNNTGNFVLPGNTFAVNYANGTAVSLGGGTYGNANVVANLAALSSNPISTTGNVTASYFFGNISQATGGYGNANVVANLAALSSNPVSTTGNITAGNITITGNTTTGINAVTVGVNNVILPNTIASFSSNVNSYTQLTLENINSGADATADFILTADNGSDTVNYGDFGIINSGYDPNTPTNSLGNIVYAADTYIYAQGNTSNTAQAGGNLVMGVTTASKNIKLFAGGANTSALIATISNAGITMNSGNITGNTAGFAIGYRDIPQVSFSANATISTSDAGKHYYSTSASNLVLTIANNASQAFAIGAAINIINRGTGTMTIAQGSGVTLYLAGNTTAGNRTLSSYGAATIQKVETDVWFVVGSGLT